MQVCFRASESMEIFVEQQVVPIQNYLSQPQRLVKAIASNTLTEQIAPELFRLQMQPLNFLDIYHFQPTVVLRVWATNPSSLFIKSVDCQIEGIEYINRRFALNLQGELSVIEIRGKTYLQGQADLEVKLELPPPLWLTPKPFLEMAGNGLLKNVLLRMKQKLLSQLLEDYRLWAKTENQLISSVDNAR